MTISLEELPTTVLDPDSWLENYGDLLFGYALARVRDKTQSEDLVQETLLAAIATAHTFKGNSKESTWLVGILRHKILDHFRELSRVQKGQDDLLSLVELERSEFNEQGAWKAPIPEWSNPEKAAEQAEFWPVLNHCIGALPEKLGTLYTLREIDGIDTDQIADALNISTKNNLWVMLSRARQQMRRCLQRRWFKPGA